METGGRGPGQGQQVLRPEMEQFGGIRGQKRRGRLQLHAEGIGEGRAAVRPLHGEPGKELGFYPSCRGALGAASKGRAT